MVFLGKELYFVYIENRWAAEQFKVYFPLLFTITLYCVHYILRKTHLSLYWKCVLNCIFWIKLLNLAKKWCFLKLNKIFLKLWTIKLEYHFSSTVLIGLQLKYMKLGNIEILLHIERQKPTCFKLALLQWQ